MVAKMATNQSIHDPLKVGKIYVKCFLRQTGGVFPYYKYINLNEESLDRANQERNKERKKITTECLSMKQYAGSISSLPDG